ncbi:hypothetical protein BDV18DRAFT_144725 [Aspergillus unguis]
MVQDVLNAGSGSPQGKYSLTFAIAPPSAVRPGAVFTLPVIVAVRPVSAANSDPLQQLGITTLLRDETGASAAVGLSGLAPATVRSRAGNTASGYANVGRLRIASPGKYRLRVVLIVNAASGVTTEGYVDSGIIHVHAGAAASQRPTSSQVLKLQTLIPENIDISQADIAAWQQV